MADNDDNELARKTAAGGAGALAAGAITIAVGTPATAVGAAALAVASAGAAVVLGAFEEATRRRTEKNTIRWARAFLADDSLTVDEAARQVEARMAADPNAARCIVDSIRTMLASVDDAAVPVLAAIAREQADLGGGPTRYTRNMSELVMSLGFSDLGALRLLLRAALDRGRRLNEVIAIACAGRELFVFTGGASPERAVSHEDPSGLLAALERSGLVRPDETANFSHNGTITLSRKGALYVPWSERLVSALDAAFVAAQ